ncbi:putative sterigmatocystin biosynthesis P450 monooxygenase, partial [Lachnellula hyalina]
SPKNSSCLGTIASWIPNERQQVAYERDSVWGDVHGHVLPHQIERLFPDLGPTFYVGTWPFGPPILAIAAPDPAYQITQAHSLPKYYRLRQYMQPRTGGGDLVTMEGSEWKKWRNIFNPGFSSGHLMTLVPEIMQDVSRFCKVPRQTAERAEVVSMDTLTTRLSLDIIGRVALNTRLNSQRGTNDFVSAMRN